ncbi:flagellar hook-basal body complex protein FliE [Methanoplanus sp. FWC-SCC4]|uniref:Flagellar hook-basal body complex protein FliE n=1 Tax=Methanochimaera problematica TaxID=2609417 RepID=A0AA97I2Y0_9EURY|nr:AAA family ATPase [Methanoplanus sp. FWC-SCC4]WOF16078.1 flagellar hook-basal body complex protein FliE [Methanoplanus sp. FWC-SCC4]
MKIIGVVGMPASGKGEFSRIAKEMNIPIVVLGDIIRNAVKDAGLKITDKNMGEMSKCLRRGLGMDALAQLSIPIIEEQKGNIVIVDGIRGDAEVDTLSGHFHDFHLVAVHSSFETRLKRLSERKRSDDLPDADSLKMRDDREIGWGLLNAFSMADLKIDNEGTMEEFEMKVKDTLYKLRMEK